MLRAHRYLKVAAVLAGALAFAACSEEDVPTGATPTGQQGRFRVVHAIADPTRADRVNITVANVPVAVNVAFGVAAPNTAVQPNPAPYYPILVGSWPVALRRTADTTVKLVDATIAVTANTDYSIYSAGTATGIDTFILTDDNTAPAATAIRLRVVHASKSSPAVDVYVTAAATDIATIAPSAAGLAYKAGSAYLTPAAGTYRVRITAAGTKAPLLLDTTLPALAAGAARTVVFLDRAAGGTPATSAVLVDR
jgi:uncharacterized protein DUF4397